MKFAYSRAPPHLQGTVMGFFDLMTGIGYFLGLGILAILRGANLLKVISHVQSSITTMTIFANSRLDFYFLILAAMILVTIIVFIIFDVKYNIDIHEVSSVNKTSRKNSITQPKLGVSDRVNSLRIDGQIVT